MVYGWLMVGTLLGDGWHNVGLWLGQCWVIVGGWLGFGWQLMLGQRLSNEQSNVGPTKYVAVGPTLNQRLGFGWRMVSVLAGMWLMLPNHSTSLVSSFLHIACRCWMGLKMPSQEATSHGRHVRYLRIPVLLSIDHLDWVKRYINPIDNGFPHLRLH